MTYQYQLVCYCQVPNVEDKKKKIKTQTVVIECIYRIVLD